MKTCLLKSALYVMPLITLVGLVTFSADLAGKAERYQAAAVSPMQPGPEMLDSSYDALRNNLYVNLGR